MDLDLQGLSDPGMVRLFGVSCLDRLMPLLVESRFVHVAGVERFVASGGGQLPGLRPADLAGMHQAFDDIEVLDDVSAPEYPQGLALEIVDTLTRAGGDPLDQAGKVADLAGDIWETCDELVGDCDDAGSGAGPGLDVPLAELEEGAQLADARLIAEGGGPARVLAALLERNRRTLAVRARAAGLVARCADWAAALDFTVAADAGRASLFGASCVDRLLPIAAAAGFRRLDALRRFASSGGGQVPGLLPPDLPDLTAELRAIGDIDEHGPDAPEEVLWQVLTIVETVGAADHRSQADRAKRCHYLALGAWNLSGSIIEDRGTESVDGGIEPTGARARLADAEIRSQRTDLGTLAANGPPAEMLARVLERNRDGAPERERAARALARSAGWRQPR